MSEPGTNARKRRRLILTLFAGFAALLVVSALLYSFAFGPTERYAESEDFIIDPNATEGQVARDLAAKGFIRNPFIFEFAYLREADGAPVRPGGYKISKSMDAWTIASQLVAPPYAVWVTVPVGARKEQVGSILAEALGWNDEQKAAWTAATADTGGSYDEGVYFPDTYFIPTDQPPAVIAGRMRDNFKAAFAPYADQALKQGVSWTKALTIASLIQRETGNISDMHIISGIIENRLKSGMPLALDDTLQYIAGKDGDWWPQVSAAATYPDSPFNTYKRKGLPPHPIDEPGLAAIDAALNPAKTDCIFYIHDPSGTLHCSVSYAGQQANVNKFLK